MVTIGGCPRAPTSTPESEEQVRVLCRSLSLGSWGGWRAWLALFIVETLVGCLSIRMSVK